MKLDALTLEELRLHRPDLVRELEQPHVAQLDSLRQQLDKLAARESAAKRRELVIELLQEYDLPLPPVEGASDSSLVSPQFIETLMRAADDAATRRLVEERAALVRSACDWNARQTTPIKRPRSRHQLDFPFMSAGGALGSAAEFAAAVRGG
jgi:hypothetical protein